MRTLNAITRDMAAVIGAAQKRLNQRHLPISTAQGTHLRDLCLEILECTGDVKIPKGDAATEAFNDFLQSDNARRNKDQLMRDAARWIADNCQESPLIERMRSAKAVFPGLGISDIFEAAHRWRQYAND